MVLIIKFMCRVLLFLFLLASSFQGVTGQVLPSEGGKLSYRIIGFTFPAQNWATSYDIEIANGTQTAEAGFYKNVIKTIHSKSNKIIGEVPAFGKPYTWRIVLMGKDGTKTKSYLYHFSTLMSRNVDPAVSRLRITKAAEKYKDAFVFVDGMRALYDMKGNPVWFLPGTDGANKEVATRDLKLTPQGSITFMTQSRPFDIDYNGNILWQYIENKANQGIDTFHHEFTKLTNGHYMGMILVDDYRLLPGFEGKVAHNATDSARFLKNFQYNSIVEYDEHNQLVWHWSGADYINNSDLRARTAEEWGSMNHDLHENGFYFDEKNKNIYLSFRNISRIIKIKYPEGTVLNTYGPLYKPGEKEWINELFCKQHSCRLSEKGYLYLFNNNECGLSAIPTVELLQAPGPGGSELKKVWEFECPIEEPIRTEIEKSHLFFHSGGNVVELPDQSLLVDMSNDVYCKVFIVSPEKKIFWSAIPEVYDPAKKKWQPPINGVYRASIIPSRKELERLIWNSEKGY